MWDHSADSLHGTIGFGLAPAPIPLSANKQESLKPRLAVANPLDGFANDQATRQLTSSFLAAPPGSFTTQGHYRGPSSLAVVASPDLNLSAPTAL